MFDADARDDHVAPVRLGSEVEEGGRVGQGGVGVGLVES